MRSQARLVPGTSNTPRTSAVRGVSNGGRGMASGSALRCEFCRGHSPRISRNQALTNADATEESGRQSHSLPPFPTVTLGLRVRSVWSHPAPQYTISAHVSKTSSWPAPGVLHSRIGGRARALVSFRKTERIPGGGYGAIWRVINLANQRRSSDSAPGTLEMAPGSEGRRRFEREARIRRGNLGRRQFRSGAPEKLT